MRRQFKGWIPNVTGRISFSAIGNSAHPTFCKYSNKADASDRYLVAFQRRDTRDFVFPRQFQGILSYFRGVEGPLYFAILAKTSDHNGRQFEKFDGKIFIFKNKKIWKSGPRAKMQKYIAAQNLYSGGPRATIQNKFGNHLTELSDYLSDRASFHVEFTLLRDGEITITHDTNFKISENAPKVEHHADEDYVRMISSQVFFFMKDISHTHQHHHSKTDTIVDLHNFNNGDDISWREQTLYALYRKIIQYKKMKGEKAKIDSLGTLSYTETFAKLCEQKLDNSKEKLPEYISDYLRESIEAARLTSELDLKESANKREKAENYLIAAVGLGFTVPALLQLTGQSLTVQPDPWLVSFAEWLLQHPVEAIVIFIMAIWASVYNIGDRNRMRYITRVLVAWNQKFSGSISLLISLLSALFVYYIIFMWEPKKAAQYDVLEGLRSLLKLMHGIAVDVYSSVL